MANEIYDITFNDVQLTDSSGDVADVTGTIEVNYQTGYMYVTPYATGLTAIDASGSTYSFTSFAGSLANAGISNLASLSNTGDATLHFQWSGTTPTYADNGTFVTATPSVSYSEPTGTLTATAVCFASGTFIRTPRGDVRVESLSAGDTVLTASGERRPIKWMGHRRFGPDFGRAPNYEVVRIAAHAFGPDRPSQDLVVSPGHSICVDLIGEIMIPAMHLVNGATVTREWRDTVTLWHVELDSHDVLVANDLPAESYLASDNRAYFEEAGATLDSLEERKTMSHADFCRPVVTGGPTLAFVRERLMERALSSGWTPSRDDELRLVFDGEIRRAAVGDKSATFVFPAEARDVRLVSNTIVPKDLGGPDNRTLGVHLAGLVLSAGGETRTIAIDDMRLRDGVHPVEPSGRRWTTGDLVLDPELWKGMSGDVSLRLSCRRDSLRKWIAPKAAERPVARPRLYAVG